MKNIAVILAGGIGARVGGNVPKQLLPLADGRSVLEHATEAFEQAECIDEVCIVMHPDYISFAEQALLRNGWQKVKHIIAGGKERWESSVNAIRLYESVLSEEEFTNTNILLHDAARPFVSQTIIANVCRALAAHEAVTVAIPATDTMYMVTPTPNAQPSTRVGEDACAPGHSTLNAQLSTFVLRSIPPRDTLMRAQTPQAFRLPLIARAYTLALQDPALQATDDCGIVHRYLPIEHISIVIGEENNKKITFREDFQNSLN
ncbi:MAG: 2-C-methyl-D-erythritol 4-phosphate cytidylyltransferase [Paludibacteraceae bacterium]